MVFFAGSEVVGATDVRDGGFELQMGQLTHALSTHSWRVLGALPLAMLLL